MDFAPQNSTRCDIGDQFSIIKFVHVYLHDNGWLIDS